MAPKSWILTTGMFSLGLFGQSDAPTIVQPGAPGASSRTLTEASVRTAPRQPTEADTNFMQGMIMHHAQAVEMTALMEARTKNKALLELGKRISISQSDEIKMMKQWLEEHGKAVPTEHEHMQHMSHMAGMSPMDMTKMAPMPGMLTPEQMAALKKSTGKMFDHLFLTGMIQHHTGALTMVQELFDTPAAGQDNQLFDFATDVDNTQRAEISIMQGMLKKEKK
jgi:uncharacterized protein (DUF305 family)